MYEDNVMEMEETSIVPVEDDTEDIVVCDESEDDGPDVGGIALLAVGGIAAVAAGVKFIKDDLPRLKILKQYKKIAKQYMTPDQILCEDKNSKQWVVYSVLGGPIYTLADFIKKKEAEALKAAEKKEEPEPEHPESKVENGEGEEPKPKTKKSKAE